MKFIKDLTKQQNFQPIKNQEELENICKRTSVDYLEKSRTMKIVTEIEKNILAKGDEYISELTKKFDGADISKFRVTEKEFIIAENETDEDFKQAIDKAYKNIYIFHQSQKQPPQSPLSGGSNKINTSKGITCWQEFRAIEKIGLYIPAGTAPLFSSVLMLAIPALIAGCEKKIICTPPNSDGSISPEILYVAKKCGITEVYKIGGAQAIFAMAYGTAQVPKVDKIFGPGNSFVTAAKMKISSFTAIDMPAGPSEVLVIADENANEKFVAADLLSQAEHGIDSQSVLVCSSVEKAKKSIEETLLQLKNLSRKDIARESLKNSFCIICENSDEMIQVSNIYAPEHLILQMNDWEKILPKIMNAGSVFCGEYSCESLGDYATGTNHTLPTSGFAKNYSGVSVASFGKMITFQEVTKEGINDLAETVVIMANREGLDGHAKAVEVRVEK